jgi:hypothetical protein
VWGLRLRTKSGRRDEQGRGTNRAPAEAGKPGRGVLLPIAHSLSRGNSSEPSQFERWRDALLGSVAASAVMLYGARPVRANCVGPAPTLTCTGVISGTAAPGVTNGGISATSPTYTTINVNNLAANIAPSAAGVAGVSLTGTGAITNNTDLGSFAILPTGTTANGITGSGSGTTAINITNKGTITSALGNGIFAQRTGAGTVTVTNITSNGTAAGFTNGIYASSAGAQVKIYSGQTTASNITSLNGRGIYGKNTTAGVTIYSKGNVRSATNTSGAPTGTTTNIGIEALSSGAGGTLSVTSVGNVDAFAQGILARSTNNGAITVNSTGDITTASTTRSSTVSTVKSYTGAITAEITSGANAINVTSTGKLTSGAYGIFALTYGTGAVTVNSTGDVSAASFIGILAKSAGGNVSLTSKGNVAGTLSDSGAQLPAPAP